MKGTSDFFDLSNERMKSEKQENCHRTTGGNVKMEMLTQQPQNSACEKRPNVKETNLQAERVLELEP